MARGTTAGWAMSATAPATLSRPSGVTSRISSGGSASWAASETARTTRDGKPAAAAAARITDDSMSAATAPVRANRAALASGVAITSRVVTSLPVGADGASAAAAR